MEREGDGGDVFRETYMSGGQSLLLRAIRRETHQTVCRRYRHCAVPTVRHDAVDAKNVIIFHMRRPSGIRLQKIEPAIEIADPKTSALIRRECRNVAVTQNGWSQLQHLLPTLPTRTHAIERIT